LFLYVVNVLGSQLAERAESAIHGSWRFNWFNTQTPIGNEAGPLLDDIFGDLHA
jgi:hypothetical protein